MVKPSTQELGDRIKAILDSQGLTNKELADRLDVTPSAVGNWVNGTNGPSRTRIPQIEQALGLPRGTLFGVQEPSTSEARLEQEVDELSREYRRFGLRVNFLPGVPSSTEVFYQRQNYGDIFDDLRRFVSSEFDVPSMYEDYTPPSEEEAQRMFDDFFRSRQPVKFASPEAAMRYILSQPLIAGYTGIHLERLSDEEKIEYANELLESARKLYEKYRS